MTTNETRTQLIESAASKACTQLVKHGEDDQGPDGPEGIIPFKLETC